MVLLKNLLGPILIEENPSASLARRIMGQEQKEDLRFLERTLHKISPTLGEGMGKLNNAIDSIENVAESIDPLTRLDNVFVGMSVDEAQRSLRRGDHIKVQRLAYTHHGIYDGEGGVYEYNDFVVRHVLLEDFSDGAKILKVKQGTIYSPGEIIGRASYRYGESAYNVVWNNCEHFATWCRLGPAI